MHQDNAAISGGCGKKFFIMHALSFLKGSLVLARHDDSVKACGALESQSMNYSTILYEPQINSRTVQGERTGA